MKKSKLNSIESKVSQIKSEDKRLLKKKPTTENLRVLNRKEEDWRVEPEMRKGEEKITKVNLRD